jgi:hypothetical protein
VRSRAQEAKEGKEMKHYCDQFFWSITHIPSTFVPE